MNTEKIKNLFEKSSGKYAVAKEMGVEYMSLQNIISGKSSPTAKTLEKIASYYHVPVGYFFDEADRDGQHEKDKEIAYLKGQVDALEKVIRELKLK